MKICAVICEYNPFHNGHLYQLQEAKSRSQADVLLCLMSGNFVQRGEAAVLDKFTRAKHAVLGGADIVIELPTVFATSNAEIFAKGAISLLSAIPSVQTLCFGTENADKLAFTQAATLLNDEPCDVSSAIKASMNNGLSFAKARAAAYAPYLPKGILTSPNNILSVEYTRAILEKKSTIDILPIQRLGGGYNDQCLQENFSSASAIRKAIKEKTSYEQNLPAFVANDLSSYAEGALDCLEKYALLTKPAAEVAKTLDCSEGLENGLKKAALNTQPLAASLASARYTASRIRRIALQNLLNIDASLVRNSILSPLYLRVLAVKKDRSEIFSTLAESKLPIIARAHDEKALQGIAKSVFDVDKFAEDVYALLSPIMGEKCIFH